MSWLTQHLCLLPSLGLRSLDCLDTKSKYLDSQLHFAGSEQMILFVIHGRIPCGALLHCSLCLLRHFSYFPFFITFFLPFFFYFHSLSSLLFSPFFPSFDVSFFFSSSLVSHHFIKNSVSLLNSFSYQISLTYFRLEQQGNLSWQLSSYLSFAIYIKSFTGATS